MGDPGNGDRDGSKSDTSTPRPGSPVRGSSTGRPIMALLDLVGRRWTLRIIWELNQSEPKPLTFRGLQERCEAMSSSVLNHRLRELRSARLIDTTAGGYALTATGADLVASLEPALAWSERWARLLEEPAAHSPGESERGRAVK